MDNARLIKLRNFLAGRNLDGVIISGSENNCYFSGFTGSAGVLLISGQATKLITDFRYIEQASQEAPDFEVIRHGSSIHETIQAEIAGLGLKRIGFEGSYLTYDEFSAIKVKELEFVSVKLDDLRMVKDQAEIANIRKAVEITDLAFSQILSVLKPGMTEREAAFELEFFMRKAGAEKLSFDTILVSGTKSALPHGTPSDKVIEQGDFVTMDFGALYNGYHADMTRTIVMGKASAKQREIYKLVLSAQLAATKAVKPGLRGKEVDAIARKIIADGGYADYFGHGLGHGVGLAIHEGPRLSPLGEVVLTPGMVVTVEPGIYLPKWGGVRIEDTVVVTADGVDILTASSKELIELDC
ncbi:MAG: ypdF [Firmicutes bacterium]|nr:ypdF [Bacillota bacterium]